MHVPTYGGLGLRLLSLRYNLETCSSSITPSYAVTLYAWRGTGEAMRPACAPLRTGRAVSLCPMSRHISHPPSVLSPLPSPPFSPSLPSSPLLFLTGRYLTTLPCFLNSLCHQNITTLLLPFQNLKVKPSLLPSKHMYQGALEDGMYQGALEGWYVPKGLGRMVCTKGLRKDGMCQRA